MTPSPPSRTKGEDSPISLLCHLYPSSPLAQNTRLLPLLRAAARTYYRQSQHSNCHVWCYYTPALPKTQNPSVLLGLEMYSTKSALERQRGEDWFREFHHVVGEEGLYARPEGLRAWECWAGWVGRGDEGVLEEGGGRVVGTFSLMVAKGVDAGGLVGVLSDFSTWVRENEPGVLSYVIFTRPKAPREAMVFVRYADGKALRSHDECEEHQEVVQKLGSLTEKTETSVWREVEDSFVSEPAGEVRPGGGSKL